MPFADRPSQVIKVVFWLIEKKFKYTKMIRQQHIFSQGIKMKNIKKVTTVLSVIIWK